MRSFVIVLLVLFIGGCKPIPDRGLIGDAAIKFSSVFVTENNMSDPNWKVRGKEVLKNEGDSVYYVSGTVEGFTSFNTPVGITKFNETMHYSGGDPNDRKNWKCLQLNIAGKEIK